MFWANSMFAKNIAIVNVKNFLIRIANRLFFFCKFSFRIICDAAWFATNSTLQKCEKTLYWSASDLCIFYPFLIRSFFFDFYSCAFRFVNWISVWFSNVLSCIHFRELFSKPLQVFLHVCVVFASYLVRINFVRRSIRETTIRNQSNGHRTCIEHWTNFAVWLFVYFPFDDLVMKPVLSDSETVSCHTKRFTPLNTHILWIDSPQLFMMIRFSTQNCHCPIKLFGEDESDHFMRKSHFRER